MANKFYINNLVADMMSNDSLWSTTTGGANDTTAPTGSDVAIFDGNGTADCSIDIASVGGVELRAGYTGTVDVVVVTNIGPLTVSAGTFQATSSTVTMSGITQTGGTLANFNAAAITVNGNLSVASTDLAGSGAWTLNVTGTNVITGGTVTNCNAAGGTALSAFTSVDGGGNTNVSFSAPPVIPTSLGERWTLRDTPSDDSWVAVAFNKVFKSFNSVAQGGQGFYSAGFELLSTASTIVGSGFRGIDCDNTDGVTIACAQAGLATERFIRSTDGGINYAFTGSVELNGYQSVAHIDDTDIWVACAESGSGNRIARSTDKGVTWTNISLPVAAQGAAWVDIIYFPKTSRLICVNYTEVGAAVMTSDDDGLTWLMQTTPGTNQWLRLTHDDDYVYASSFNDADNTGQVMRSLTGLSDWTVSETPCDGKMVALDANYGVIVATMSDSPGCAAGKQAYISTDQGVTWKQVTTPSPNQSWQATASGGGIFFTVGQSGTGQRSMTSGITKWIGDGLDELASNDLNWDGGIPASDNRALFSGDNGGNELKNCTFDITLVLAENLDTAYTSVVTQDNEVSVIGIFFLDGGVGTEWTTNSYDLYVDGDYIVMSGEGVIHNAGGTVYLGSDEILVDNGQGARYVSPVKIHHSKATPTVAKTHKVTDWTRANSRSEDLTFGENQTIELNGGLATFKLTIEPNVFVTSISALLRTLTVEEKIINPENATWNANVNGGIRIEFSYVILDTDLGNDYGNVRLQIEDDMSDLGDAWTTTAITHFYNAGSNTKNYYLSGNLNCGGLLVGRNILPSFASIFTQRAGSDLQINGDVIVYEDDNIQANKWIRLAGTLNTVINGDLTVETLAELDFTGDTSTISIYGDISLSATALINWGDVTVDLFGVDQTVDWGGNPPKNIKYTGSGTLTHIGLVAITGKHIFKPSAPLAVKFPNGGTLGALELDASGVSSFGTLDLDSVDGASTYTMPVAQAGAAMKYVSVGRMILTGVAQPIDSNTSTDLGGNRLVPPEVDGLEFTPVAASRDIIRSVARSVTKSVARPV